MKTAKLGQAQQNALNRFAQTEIANVGKEKPEQRIAQSLVKRRLCEVVERTGKRIDKVRVVHA